MNAKQARQQALENKKQIEENRKLKEEKLINTDVTLFYNHLCEKIEYCVKLGKLNTETITFPSDRFALDVIREVSDRLKNDGFTLNQTEHNAFQTKSFYVSWV